MKPYKRGIILGPDELPLNQPPDGLDSGTQALIEARVITALDGLRVYNEVRLREMDGALAHRWRYAALVSFAIAAVSVAWGVYAFIFAPKAAIQQVEEYMRDKMTVPAIREALDTAAKGLAEEYVDKKLVPLEQRTHAAENQLLEVARSTEVRQEELADGQRLFSERLKLHESAAMAKSGDGDSYEHLKKMADASPELRVSAEVLRRDVDMFFQIDRFNFAGQQYIQHAPTKQRIELSIDEALEYLSNPSAKVREAAANHLHDIGSPRAVGPLMKALETEKDLRVLSRITRALATLGEVTVEPLNSEYALRWWLNQQSRPELNFLSGSFGKVSDLFRASLAAEVGSAFSAGVYDTSARAAIPHLRFVLDREPLAHKTREYLCYALCAVGDLEEAKKQLDMLSRKEARYRGEPLPRAYIAMVQNEHEKAITALRQATPYDLGRANVMAIFAPLRQDRRIPWVFR